MLARICNVIALFMLVNGVLLSGTTAWAKPACCHTSNCPSHRCVVKHESEPVKKVVYEVKCVPVCEHHPAKFLDCDCCPVCKLHYKKVLIKREIVVRHECKTTCEPVPVNSCGCGSCGSCGH